jgi:hypothetical protein
MSKEKYRKEIEDINEWCLTVIEVVIQHVGDINPVLKMLKENILISPANYNKKMLTACENRQRDISEWAIGLSEEHQIAINKILFEKFHNNLLTYKKKDDKIVEKVIKSGLIQTPLEYQLIEQAVSGLSQSEPDSNKIPVMNKLLNNYGKHLNQE